MLQIAKFLLSFFQSFLTYLHPILFNNNCSVSRNFSPGHVEEHSRQLIYETNILNISINFKIFLTNLTVLLIFILFLIIILILMLLVMTIVIPERILTLYTAFITVLERSYI